jgi:hypothetical protein
MVGIRYNSSFTEVDLDYWYTRHTGGKYSLVYMQTDEERRQQIFDELDKLFNEDEYEQNHSNS